MAIDEVKEENHLVVGGVYSLKGCREIVNAFTVTCKGTINGVPSFAVSFNVGEGQLPEIGIFTVADWEYFPFNEINDIRVLDDNDFIGHSSCGPLIRVTKNNKGELSLKYVRVIH